MPQETQELRALNIKIPSKLHAQLKELADANRRSMTAQVQVAIETQIKVAAVEGAAA